MGFQEGETDPYRAGIVESLRQLETSFIVTFGHAEAPTGSDLSTAVHRIRDGSARCLSLFHPGDEEVAWWCQVELFGSLAQVLGLISQKRPLVDDRGDLTFLPPRSESLVPWALHDSLGPRYRGQHCSAPDNIDDTRVKYVTPYSEAPEDMLWAPINDWRVR